MNLLKCEQEVVITFDADSDMATLYTMSKNYISCRKPRNYSDEYREQKRMHA